jgi:methylenetetrahydrofolate dehydrogenase (NADP+)/methenyltetrahydrofolate cyclohydrolase
METSAIILDGREVSEKIRENIKKEVEYYLQRGYREPSLAVILVGEDPPSLVYVRNKRKACEKVGIKSLFYHLPYNTKLEELLELIAELNAREDVDGILVQLPLPPTYPCRR